MNHNTILNFKSILHKARLVTALSCMILICTSCEKWFDVTSSSEVRGSQHFGNVLGFRQTLTGCYIAMANEKAYGKNLTWFATELLGHQAQTKLNTLSNALSEHAYQSPEVIAVTDAIWSQMWNVIVNANDGLKNLEERKNELNQIDYSVIRGELLAIRAYVHFDLLRLFGYGNYAQRNSELNSKLTLPYATTRSKNLPSQVTGSVFYTSLIKDIEEAISLLKDNDPVSNTDMTRFSEVNKEGFYKFRDIHLNYYAVKALEARVHMWFGGSAAVDKALEAALEVISLVEKGGFTNSSLQTEMKLLELSEISDKNSSLTPEALFAVQVQDLGSKTNNYYIPSFVGTHSSALIVPEERIKSLYGEVNTDVRMTKLMKKNPNSSPIAYISLKYDQSALDSSNRGKVNLIRIPEVYYIASEAYLLKGDTEKSIEYLDKVRNKRGNTVLDRGLSKEKVMEEIKKEYEKEFIAEGVLFYQYKRWGTPTLPFSTEQDKMTDKEYVLPFPELERKSGYIQ